MIGLLLLMNVDFLCTTTKSAGAGNQRQQDDPCVLFHSSFLISEFLIT